MRNTQGDGKSLMSNFNKSILADHAVTENDIIDWEGAKIPIKSQTEEPDK